MHVTLYYNKSDGRVLNKTITPITPRDAQTDQIPVQVLEDTSLVDPTFIFSAPTNVMDANYLFADDFGRYYFITDKIFSKNKIYVKCHVDVLMSFKSQIKGTKAILERTQEDAKFDLYLNDAYLPLENRNCVRTIDFPNGFNDTSEFILVLAGDNTKNESAIVENSNSEQNSNSEENEGGE